MLRLRLFRAAALLAVPVLVASACGKTPDRRATDTGRAVTGAGTDKLAAAAGRPEATTGAPGATPVAGSVRLKGAPAPVPIAPPSAAKRQLGVTDKEITVVYYWKGDRTRTSPYVKGTGLEPVLDEAQAFRTWVEYINRHANGGGDIMGYKFNLHGRKLRPVVIEAGNSAEDNVASVTDIKSAKPFAAVAAHGSVSTYACPLLAQAGILNLWTYDVDFDLAGRSKGWCLPGGATFDAQTAVMERYLTKRVATTPASSGEKRVFGFLYAEYPGLVHSAPLIAKRLKALGLNVPVVRSMSAELSEAQQQATTIATAFRAAGVNTMIMPDAGAPLSFTPAAQSIGWKPDYVVWPCSGQDAPGMVRLYSPAQWNGATGLTCYAQDFMVDLTHGSSSRASEWYRKYDSMDRGEPPSPAPFVYASLLPLVAGITESGRDLTAERFLQGLNRFRSYRYAAAEGRTSKPNHMRLAAGQKAHPLVDDFTVLRWSAGARSDSGGTGNYVFPESGRRYDVSDGF